MTIICAYRETGVGTWCGSDTGTTIGSHTLESKSDSKFVEYSNKVLLFSGVQKILNVINISKDKILEPDDPFEIHQILRETLKKFNIKPDEKN